MGLAAPRKRAKISHDPNNTSWSQQYGRKILASQGWTPGSYLGAKDAAHASHFTKANAAHIRVALREDNLGLGAGPSSANHNPSLGLFSEILGRLNGESQEQLDKKRNAREDIARRRYVVQRFGASKFVSGGYLVGDKMENEMQTPSSGEAVEVSSGENGRDTTTDPSRRKSQYINKNSTVPSGKLSMASEDAESKKARKAKKAEKRLRRARSVDSDVSPAMGQKPIKKRGPHSESSLEGELSSGSEGIHRTSKIKRRHSSSSKYAQITKELAADHETTASRKPRTKKKRSKKSQSDVLNEESRLAEANQRPTNDTKTNAETTTHPSEASKVRSQGASIVPTAQYQPRRSFASRRRNMVIDSRSMKEILMVQS